MAKIRCWRVDWKLCCVAIERINHAWVSSVSTTLIILLSEQGNALWRSHVNRRTSRSLVANEGRDQPRIFGRAKGAIVTPTKRSLVLATPPIFAVAASAILAVLIQIYAGATLRGVYADGAYFATELAAQRPVIHLARVTRA